MRSPGLPYRLGDARASLRRAWRWWCSELAQLVPQGLRHAFTMPNAAIAIDVEDDQVHILRFADGDEEALAHIPRAAFDAALLRQLLAPHMTAHWLLRDIFALRLPAVTALSRNLQFPLAAQHKLGNILRFELDRQSPIDSNLIYYDFRIVARDRAADRIDVMLRIVRRELVDAALATCRAAGVAISVVAFVGDETPADGGNFPVDPRASRRLGIRKHLVPALAWLAAVLAVLLVAAAVLRNQGIADQLTDAIRQARPQAAVSRQLLQKIQYARSSDDQLIRQKQNPLLVGMLAEVTRLLPAGSWLTAFEYQDGEIHIQGFSHSAASLIAAMDASPLFAEAQFRAPLIQGAAPGQERFDIAFKLRRKPS